MKILDCTLRDGGYYTQWDFSDEIVSSYLQAMNVLPVDYIEVGYRNLPEKEYLGKYGYTPLKTAAWLRENCTKKIALMLNEKSVREKDLDALLNPIVGLADMIRMAVDPQNFARAVKLARAVKERGFEVGFNVMYMSKWQQMPEFLNELSAANDVATVFSMVDSFGGVMPEDVAKITRTVKEKLTCPLGFHGHNNLHMAMANALAAINNGVEFIDATICGMGRGAGNLELELLLTIMSRQGMLVDFNVLSDVVGNFAELQKKYGWGANLPYMISGANSLPQKQVMDWVSNRTYTFNSIVRALNNQTVGLKDNAKYSVFEKKNVKEVLILGGGQCIPAHAAALKEYLNQNPETAVIFASARRVSDMEGISNPCYYCLVGSEAKRLQANILDTEKERICVLPPYPRQMGSEVPDIKHARVYELDAIRFTEDMTDSCTAVALQLALDLGAETIYMSGYDGYVNGIHSEKERTLSQENITLFDLFKTVTGKKLIALTPTLYAALEKQSVYQLI